MFTEVSAFFPSQGFWTSNKLRPLGSKESTFTHLLATSSHLLETGSHAVAQADLKLMESDGSTVMTPRLCPACCALKQPISWLMTTLSLCWVIFIPAVPTLVKGHTMSMHLRCWGCSPVHSTKRPLCLQFPSDLHGKDNTAELSKLPCPVSGKKATKNLPTPSHSSCYLP